jgi:hypothetical protein
VTRRSRTAAFARLPDQEKILRELNELLGTAEREASHGWPPSPVRPLVLVVGAPRSGTTLMLQWLAASGCFAYPTNLLSRFYGAPYVGARIQQLLTDPVLDYRSELEELHAASRTTWASEVGKTRGILEPHEFFYFWRRFFPVDQAQKLTDDQLARSDPKGFAAGWAALESAFAKPVAAKGILLQYDIHRLAEWLPTAVFVHTRRDPFFNMQSLLGARERVFGDKGEWFSVRPPEYLALQHADPYTQVAGQVLFTNRSIDAELRLLPPQRKLAVDYEAFCGEPAATWAELQRRFSISGSALPAYGGPPAFECTNVVTRPAADADAIRRAYDVLAGR